MWPVLIPFTTPQKKSEWSPWPTHFKPFMPEFISNDKKIYILLIIIFSVQGKAKLTGALDLSVSYEISDIWWESLLTF